MPMRVLVSSLVWPANRTRSMFDVHTFPYQTLYFAFHPRMYACLAVLVSQTVIWAHGIQLQLVTVDC